MTATETRDLPCDLCNQSARWALLGEAGDFLLCEYHHNGLPTDEASGWHELVF